MGVFIDPVNWLPGRSLWSWHLIKIIATSTKNEKVDDIRLEVGLLWSNRLHEIESTSVICLTAA